MKYLKIILIIVIGIPLLLISPALVGGIAVSACIGFIVLAVLENTGLYKPNTSESGDAVAIKSAVIGAMILIIYYSIKGSI